MNSKAITTIGAWAHVNLSVPQSGKILATFSNTIYLLTDDAELFWIVSDNQSMHRRALKTPALPAGPQSGSPFQTANHRLTIDPDIFLDFGTASIWHEPQINPQNTIEITKIPTRLQTLFSALDLSQAKGFGKVIPALLRFLQNNPTDLPSPSHDLILARARPFILNIAHACLTNQPSHISQNFDALIGLGNGLTPSGDDFLGGVLFALKILHTAYPNQCTAYAINLEPYRARTHPISFALLQDHANGHAIEPLHDILNGILSKTPPHNIDSLIAQLTRIGHSTGWDLLAGLLTGLLSTHRKRD
ncbi:MAG TPA: DUF2877 domain-containing protein [Anaerolineales bacterium]|nr:DUF2877 domain-containing protein [Anaerolineales bacterium]